MLTKAQRAELLVAALEREYPDAKCSLDYEKPYELLVATRLAAQCTDARVNQVTPLLFGRYPTLEALAGAEVAEVARIVAPCGLGNTKARDIVACCKELAEGHGGTVPDDIDGLLKLPGVGRKTANLIVGDVYGKPAVVCDTHCIRITNLMGLSSSQNPAVVEKQLREVLPPEKSNDFCHRLVLHGHAVCKARKPACERCAAREWCAHGSLPDSSLT
jgi:endonuclease-3